VFSADLLANAVVAGLLLGGFYAAVAIGLAIVFGQLDIVNIAHPAFIIAGAYIAYILNSRFGVDPVLVGLLVAPIFFVVGALIYRIYFLAFERTGQESLSGLAFFFPWGWGSLGSQESAQSIAQSPPRIDT
jgi:branched-chain amino acid transport system permease protein